MASDRAVRDARGMALRIIPITEPEDQTSRRALGVLVNASVDANGVDFDLSAWAGHKIRITVSAAAQLIFAETTGVTITQTTLVDAAAADAAPGTTNGASLAAGQHTMVAPVSDLPLATRKVYARIAADSSTVSVKIERA